MAFTNNGSVRLWWDEVGTGDPVLLIMGFSWPAQMWHRLWPALSDQFRVIRFDNRGIGQSDAPRGPYSVADMVGDCIAVLDAAGVSRAHIFGASMGGGIAQEFALTHPERTASLILGCTAAPDRDAEPAPKIPWILKIIPPRIIIRRRLQGGYGANFSPEAIEEDRAILKSTRQSTRGILGQAGAVAAYSSRNRVAQIIAPTLVLHGEADATVPIEEGRILANLIPGAKLETFPGEGHNFMSSVDCPANRVVKEFLESQPRLEKQQA
jgi:pimeloyl-ACP methyl ester carboxylesterase